MTRYDCLYTLCKASRQVDIFFNKNRKVSICQTGVGLNSPLCLSCVYFKKFKHTRTTRNQTLHYCLPSPKQSTILVIFVSWLQWFLDFYRTNDDLCWYNKNKRYLWCILNGPWKWNVVSYPWLAKPSFGQA